MYVGIAVLFCHSLLQPDTVYRVCPGVSQLGGNRENLTRHIFEDELSGILTSG